MTDLAQWDELRTAIEEAQSIPELKNIRDKAEALRYAAKVAGLSTEIVRKASVIKILAERRAGAYLLQMPKQSPGDYKRPQPTGVLNYKSMDIDSRDASKWQRIASIPDHDFESWLTTAKDITTAGALQVSRSFQEKPEKTPTPKPVSEFSGRYSVILADPSNTETDLMSLCLKSDGGDKTVQDISELNSLLFFWSKAEGLEKSIKIMESWGFSYETVAFSWIKRDRDGNPAIGKGDWTAGNVELCLLGRKGDGLPRQSKEVSSVLETVVLEEGEKPAELRSRILALVGEVSRIEMFPKHKVKGWDSYSV